MQTYFCYTLGCNCHTAVAVQMSKVVSETHLTVVAVLDGRVTMTTENSINTCA